MADIAIRAEHLGKSYLVGHQAASRERYSTFRDVVSRNARDLARKARDMLAGRAVIQGDEVEEFWALKDVNFEIAQGDRVGIIGRNGAGKSTLLKVLSRITEPTIGRVTLRGRVASLLEVGTGFHPELTGRENIYLNGAILGMSRSEVRQKFDEIVAFSEVERFLDTPVKRYSSGMYVRLAFSVAAHLDSDILIVDEVLAVGDAQFQKKCLGRMDDLTKGGKTVLFVSHNINVVEQLCNRIIVLDRGEVVVTSTNIRDGVNFYLSSQKRSVAEWLSTDQIFVDENYIPLEFRLLDSLGNVVSDPIRNDSDLYIEIIGVVDQSDPALCIGYAIYDENEQLLYWSYHTDLVSRELEILSPGKWRFSTKLPKRLLNQGKYRIEMIATIHCHRWILQPGHHVPSLEFEIQGGLSDSPYWQFKRPGVLAVELPWTHMTIAQEKQK